MAPLTTMSLSVLLFLGCLLGQIYALDDHIGDACRYYSTFFDFGCEKVTPQCLCSLDPFIQTVVKCIYTHVPDQDQWVSWQRTEEYCNIDLDLDSIKWAVNSSNTTFLPPTEVFRPVNPYSQPIMMSTEKIMPYAQFLEVDGRNYAFDHLFSWVPLIFLFGIFALRSFINISTYLFPQTSARFTTPALAKFRKHISLPPLGRYHHMKKTQVAPFLPKTTVPTRSQSIIIAGLVFINVFLLVIKIECAPSNPLMSTKLGMIAYFIGRRSGWLCFVEMVLLFVFSARNNIWIQLTGWPLETFNVFHKWVGIMSVFQVIIHSLGYYISYKIENRWDERIVQAWLQWGVAGTVFFCLIPPLALRYARNYNYELFLFVHIALSILVLVASWYHLSEINLGYGYLVAMILLWSFDRIARLVRTIVSGAFCSGNVQLLPGGELVRIEADYSRKWKWYPGSYVFVHIMTPQLFLQSHPFTLLKTQDDKLVMYVRVLNGATKSLADMAASKGNEASVRLLLDGPYGATAPLKHYHTVLLISGGVGVTFTLAHAMELIALQDSSVERIVFIWVVQDRSYIKNFSPELKGMADTRIEFRFFVTRDIVDIPGTRQLLSKNGIADIETNSGRPDLIKIVSTEILNAQGPLAIAVCGPETMSDDVRSAVVGNLDKCQYRVEYIEDAFTW